MKQILFLLLFAFVFGCKNPTGTPTPTPSPTPVDPGPAEVLPEDTVLTPPEKVAGYPILGTITGYEMNSPCPYGDDKQCELPIYSKYDVSQDEWWDNLVEELLFSRVNVVMAHGRGCLGLNDGDSSAGGMCPRQLRHLVAAIDRAGARDVIRLGMFDDTGAYPFARSIVKGLPYGTPFDLADRDDAIEFFWERNMKPWFDTVPQELWYRHEGRPVVAFWSLADGFFENQSGNASWLLNELRRRFQERYGLNPLFNIDSTWVDEDSTITSKEAWGVNTWFNPPVNNHTYYTWNGKAWGCTVPSYRDPATYPGCGVACREFLRGAMGSSLRTALNNGRTKNAVFTLLEGHTNIAESAGYYRSLAWEHPNLYLNIVREFSDPLTKSIRFEAEMADAFHQTVEGPNYFRRDGITVDRLPGHGWYKGWNGAGDWIEFKQSYLGSGTYRFTARYATPLNDQSISIAINGQELEPVKLLSTGSWDNYQLVHLGAKVVTQGKQDIRIIFKSGGVNLDWFFAKKR